MPELPEVETVRRGLAPHLTGARILAVDQRRPDLRFPFPPGFATALEGATITEVDRRAKYLLIRLSTGRVWISHLGMTGTYRFGGFELAEPSRYRPVDPANKHDHLVVGLEGSDGSRLSLLYNDARRFGFMDLLDDEGASPHLKDLGPEPLSNHFSAQSLASAMARRSAPMKAILLDQSVVAGLGNIYVSEALYRAGIRPDAPGHSLLDASGGPSRALEGLVDAIREVLSDAIAAGGSTLRDFRNSDGGNGYFQHRFAVYDRQGEPCQTPGCSGRIERLVQSGRSSFFCPVCQH